jgi:TatA/E family protein of Tat protein translocase
MFGPLGVPEMLFILVLALLIFGPKRLPELGRTIGRAMGEFRRASTDLRRTLNNELALEDETPRRPQAAVPPRPAAAPPARPATPPSGAAAPGPPAPPPVPAPAAGGAPRAAGPEAAPPVAPEPATEPAAPAPAPLEPR